MLLYCNGKKGYCDRDVCDKTCEHYTGTGAKYVKKQTEQERIQTMSTKELGEFLCSLMCSDCCHNRCPAKEYCSNGHNGMEKYLSRPAKEDE